MDWRACKAPEREDTSRWWAIGLWTRLAFAGVMAASGGIAMLVDSPSSAAPGGLLALGGTWLAWTGWRGVRDALRDGEDAPMPARVSPSRRPA